MAASLLADYGADVIKLEHDLLDPLRRTGSPEREGIFLLVEDAATVTSGSSP